MILEHLVVFILACITLVISAEFLVKSLTKIAYYLKMTEFVVGFMVVALATSIPELFVGLTSALEGDPALSLGNVIGANIIDLTLVIGIVTLIRRGITIETMTVKRDTLYMFLIVTLPLILMFDREMSRGDGLILLVAFSLYVWRLITQKRRFREVINHVPKKQFIRNVFLCLFSLALLMVSAHFVVRNATFIASALSLSSILIGLFMISFGTTLPELTFETRAVIAKHRYMALGDLIGSVVANSTLVLGLVALIHPITVTNFLIFLTSSFFMITVAFIFMTFIECEKHILWQEGIALILLYVLFVIIELNLSHPLTPT